MGLDLLNGILEGFRGGMKDIEEIESRKEDRRMKKLEWEAKAKSSEEQKARQKFADSMDVRQAGFKTPQLEEGQSLYDQNPNDFQYDPNYLKIHSPGRKAGAGGVPGAVPAGTNKLPADKVLSVQAGASMPKLLIEVEQALKSAGDSNQGPVQGRIAKNNPWNTKAATVNAQLKIAAQKIGSYLEGGVLRKEDEIKYQEMLPGLQDTPDVAKNKLAIVNKMLIDKHNADTQALADQGYDTRAFSQVDSPPGLFEEGLLDAPPAGLMQAGAPNPSSIGNALFGGGKKSGGKIKVSNGKEELMIEPGDLKDAEKDGYKRVK